MRRTHRGLGALALGVTVMIVSACGDSGGGAHAAAGTDTGSAGASGSGAKIMVVGDITSTIPFTVPEIVPAVKGALKDSHVQVLTCDSKGDPNAAQDCAREAVSEGAVAVINGFGNLNVDQSVLEQAGIPVLGTALETSPVSYATSSAFAQYVALGVGLGKQGCTKLGIIDLPNTDFLVDNIKRGFESTGGKEVARAAVAANAPDLTPAIAKITGAGAQCLALSLPPTGVAQAITAVKQSGKDLKMGGISAVFSQQLLSSLGSLTDGLLVVDDQLSQYDPGTQVVRKDMDAVGGQKAELTPVGILSWTAGKVVAAALAQVKGDVTASSLTTALNGLKDVKVGGVIPPWNSQPLANPAFARFMNHYGISYLIKNGKPVRSGDFYDLAPIIDQK